MFTGLDEALQPAASHEVAILACPHDAHHVTAMRLLYAGIPVLKEKPFALGLTQATELAAHADVGLRVLVQRPHSQLYALAIDALERVGPLLSYRIHLARDTSDYSATWRACPTRSGGGVICDLGYHAFDLIARFAPPARSVHAVTTASPAHRRQLEVEENAQLIVTHDNGVNGNLYLSRCADWADVIELIAAGGRVTLADTRAHLVMQESGGQAHEVELSADENPKARMLAHHLTTLGETSVSRVEARIGLGATALIEAAYASLRLQRPAAVTRPGFPESVRSLEGSAS